jgi:hypothetical protein
MNPYYQFAIVEGYSNADALVQKMTESSLAVSEPVREEIIKDQVSAVYEKPLEEKPLEEKPLYEAKPLYERPTYKEVLAEPVKIDPAIISPLYEEKPLVLDGGTVTYVGDTKLPVQEGTTINIFNPDGQTSTTSSSGGISIDGETGETDTEATDPNAGNAPSGGGGGGGGGSMGGGGGGGGEKGGQRMRVVQKTIIPLLVIAAGIGVIILKPIK